MKIYEALQLNRSTFETFLKAGVSMKDILHIELYNEFRQLKKDGMKIGYIVAHLSQEYSVCERKVYSIINKFEKPLKA